MPLATILLTDTLSQWMAKDNAMISQINTLSGSGSILSLSSPSPGQIFVYNGSTFQNVSVTGDISLSSTGVMTVVGGNNLITKGRMRFAGSMSTLY